MLLSLFKLLFFLALLLITWEDLSASLVFHRNNLLLRTILGLRLFLIPMAYWLGNPVFYFLLLLFQILPFAIHRKNFNGASDYLCLLLLLAICLSAFFPMLSPYFHLYIFSQIVLSYLISGVLKAKQKTWWTGDALRHFVASPKYYTPPKIKNFIQKNSKIFSRAVLFWEVSFPLAVFNLQLLYFYLGVGIIFHLGNFFTFGLNRFFWLWISTYPLLLFFSSKLQLY